MNEPLKPSASLLIKLGSLLVHYEEMLSSDGHELDKAAIDSLQQDSEIIDWKKEMTKLALLPLKRKP